MIHEARVRRLNGAEADAAGEYVLYWMQASQRTACNHALEHAVEQANALRLPLLVGFGLMADYPEANERHYAFMLEGLRDVSAALEKRGATLIVRHGPPEKVALKLAGDAAIVVCDRGYMRHQKRWRDAVAAGAGRAVVQVESDVVVPVETASTKQEYAARTIRPRITKHLGAFLKPLRPVTLKRGSLDLKVKGDVDVSDVDGALARLKLDRSIKRSSFFTGGEAAAHKLLDAFIQQKLHGYDVNRNEPAAGASSTMSGYLHFGQISPVELSLAVRGHEAAPESDREAYIEELVVRRELSMNYVHYSPKYDSYEGLPEWAQKTLGERRGDKRPAHYSRDELERAKTHDPYWNAAQMEMVLTGFMHNYMRMYWGKKILEWSRSPEQAFIDTLYLNNKYFIDGRDPNSFANVAWIYGLHDRPWGPARPIFGTVRYMNAAGLERKFDIDAYVKQVAALPR